MLEYITNIPGITASDSLVLLALIELLEENHEQSNMDIIKKSNVKKGTTISALKKWEDMGVISTWKTGKSKRYSYNGVPMEYIELVDSILADEHKRCLGELGDKVMLNSSSRETYDTIIKRIVSGELKDDLIQLKQHFEDLMESYWNWIPPKYSKSDVRSFKDLLILCDELKIANDLLSAIFRNWDALAYNWKMDRHCWPTPTILCGYGRAYIPAVIKNPDIDIDYNGIG